MKIRNSVTSLFAIAVTALSSQAYAQATSDIPVWIADNGDGPAPGRDTLYFGVNPAATNGKDVSLGEEEQPPAPPEGVFDARWINVGSTKDLGQGVKKNYHAYSSAQQIDTFRIKLQPAFLPGKSGYPVTISWPDLSKHFKAASLRFVDGDGNAETKDMLTSNSITFSNPSSVTSTITITTAQPGSFSGGVPNTAMNDFQVTNYPNPARRENGTTVSYSLPRAASVSVKIYNTLGELVSTVLDERQAAASHSVRIDTRALESGSYYCIINAGGMTGISSFILAD